MPNVRNPYAEPEKIHGLRPAEFLKLCALVAGALQARNGQAIVDEAILRALHPVLGANVALWNRVKFQLGLRTV